MKYLPKNLSAMLIFALLSGGAFLQNITAQNQSSDTTSSVNTGNRPDGASVRHIKLSPTGNATFAEFGSSVAISGNTAVVYDATETTTSGAVSKRHPAKQPDAF